MPGTQKVSFGSKLATLLAATTITTDATVAAAAQNGFGDYRLASIVLTVAGKVMDASTTLNVRIQYSPDDGTTWDDLVSFAQLTSAAIGDGAYVVYLNPQQAAGAVDRAITDGTLAAGSIRNIHWGDWLRVKRVSANFSGTDTVTITVTAYMHN